MTKLLLFLILTLTVINIGLLALYVKANSLRRKETIEMLKTAIEAHEEKIATEKGHSERVSEVCYLIATLMNLEDKDKETVRIAGLLHDIGKIGIEERILRKNGKLSSEEEEFVKKHVEIGKNILEKHRDLALISKYIYMHHERPDGKGYPKNEGNIPKISAIISVADAIDAILTRKESLDFEFLKEELIANKGRQFDSAVVDIVLSNIEDVKRLYKQMNVRLHQF